MVQNPAGPVTPRIEDRYLAQYLLSPCWEFIAAEVGSTSQMVSLFSKIADFSHIMNAQLRLRGKARAPFSVRLRGRVQLSGWGEVVLGEGVSLNGTVVAIELVTYTSGRI